MDPKNREIFEKIMNEEKEFQRKESSMKEFIKRAQHEVASGPKLSPLAEMIHDKIDGKQS